MGLFRLVGFLAIVPATILLTISFFVLLALRKIEAQGLKAFGYVVASLLWVGALMIFSLGIYTVSTGRHPMMSMFKNMQCPFMQGMMGDQAMMKTKGCMNKGQVVEPMMQHQK